ncbi:MAG: hypothetical protein JXA04_10820 [Gammaproteobacteria bacterium]|nr:hypothetical protein [Gammaproteobacteria bacterium]
MLVLRFNIKRDGVEKTSVTALRVFYILQLVLGTGLIYLGYRGFHTEKDVVHKYGRLVIGALIAGNAFYKGLVSSEEKLYKESKSEFVNEKEELEKNTISPEERVRRMLEKNQYEELKTDE